MTSVKSANLNPGYDERDIVMDYWYRIHCLSGMHCINKFLAKDVKCIIQLYSCPIPFNILNQNISFELIKNDTKLYSFEPINDIFEYLENQSSHDQDVIYHPLQPIVPDIMKSNISKYHNSNISFHGLFLNKNNNKCIKYILSEDIGQLWKCKNGKQDYELDIVEINHDHTIKCKLIDNENNEIYKEKTLILSNDLYNLAIQYIQTGINLSDIGVSVISAPLRLPNEKHIVILSMITDLGWLHTVD